MHNHTWELVSPNHPIKVIGSKWVFKIKYNPDGSVNIYKARLVAKGYHHTFSVDYTKTFSLVVKSSTIIVTLSLAVINEWFLKQIDINNAFFNSHLIEVVYMQQPYGFVHPNKPNHVCRLYKALYGLKQTPSTWFDKLKMVLTQQWRFSNSKSDISLFFRRVDN